MRLSILSKEKNIEFSGQTGEQINISKIVGQEITGRLTQGNSTSKFIKVFALEKISGHRK